MEQKQKQKAESGSDTEGGTEGHKHFSVFGEPMTVVPTMSIYEYDPTDEILSSLERENDGSDGS